MKLILTILCLFIVLCSNPLSTEAQTIFQKEYRPAISAPVVIDTLEDGYLVAGSADTLTAGGKDGFVMKINFNGIPLWSKTYGGTKDDMFYSMQRMHNGHFILSGFTKSFVNTPSDSGNIYLVEMDTSGIVIRTKSIGTANSDVSYSVKETNDNGFIIAGSTDVGAYSSAYLVKTDSLMNIEWSHVYSDTAFNVNIARAVTPTSDGGYAFTGYSTLTTAVTDTNMFIVKTDSAGSVVLATHYFFTDSTNYSQRGVFGYDIIQNSAGHIVAVGAKGGYYLTAFSNIYTWLLIEADTNGAIVYSKSFSLNTGNCRAESVQEIASGGYILGGYMGNYFSAMIRASPSIVTQWCYHYDQSYNPTSMGYCVRNTTDGGFILSGSLLTGAAIRLVKTSSAGNSGCAQAVPVGPGGASGNVTLASSVLEWSSVSDADTAATLTISHNVIMTPGTVCFTLGVEETAIDEIIRISPNPSPNLFYISTKEEICSITVYNCIREKVYTSAGQAAAIDLTKAAAGIYFYTVALKDGRIHRGKLVKE